MKHTLPIRLFAAFTLLLLLPVAFAEASLENEMTLTVNGETVRLQFDPNPSYSSFTDGYLHASYYAELDEALYELFMIFPAAVRSGDTISPEACMEGGDESSGFLLFITTKDQDITTLATQDVIGAFPEGSGYAITFCDVDDTDMNTSYTGTLSGTLVDVDSLYNASGATHAIEGSFHFSTALTKAEEEAPVPSLPLPDGAEKI